MPTYCYSTKSTIYERFFPFGEAPGHIRIGNKFAKRDFQAEQVGRPSKSGWPITCYASGVNANQAQELRDCLQEAGVPTEVTKDGDPVYTSHLHRKRALKARSLHDNASFN